MPNCSWSKWNWHLEERHKERVQAIFLAIQWWWKGEQDRWRLLYQIPGTAQPWLCPVTLPRNLKSSPEPCPDDHPHFPKHVDGFNPVGHRKANQTHVHNEQPPRRCHGYYWGPFIFNSSDWMTMYLFTTSVTRERLEFMLLPMQWDISISPLLLPAGECIDKARCYLLSPRTMCSY